VDDLDKTFIVCCCWISCISTKVILGTENTTIDRYLFNYNSRVFATTPPQPWVEGGGKMNLKKKSEAILEAIRKTEVGNDIILHNNDMSIWCILTVKCKEHKEDKTDEGGITL